MLRRLYLLSIVMLLLASPASPATVSTPQGQATVFSRGELLDVLGILELAGAEVRFARAAGSYTAILGEHEVQFTPGGSLAVVDGRLTPLPGPVRTLEGHQVGSLSTLGALLGPLGWTIVGTSREPRLLPVTGGERLSVELAESPSGTLLVVGGSRQQPRLASGPGLVTLDFPAPVELAQPFFPQREVLGVETRDNRLVVHLAPGVEMASSFSVEEPPRFVLRLGRTMTQALGTGGHTGPLVVLDPGHGGDDHGARGPGGELEKDITLAVARVAASFLGSRGVTTRLTREGDYAVPLVERTSLANRVGADAFLSIHVNSSPARGAKGAETYFMSADASDSQAAAAAERENAVASPNAVGLILWDLAHVNNLNASSTFAQALQQRLDMAQGITDRGVKQAPFVVLTGTVMPAALVEVGFLSNQEEAGRLLSAAGQQEIGVALGQGILAFLASQQVPASPLAAASP